MISPPSSCTTGRILVSNNSLIIWTVSSSSSSASVDSLSKKKIIILTKNVIKNYLFVNKKTYCVFSKYELLVKIQVYIHLIISNETVTILSGNAVLAHSIIKLHSFLCITKTFSLFVEFPLVQNIPISQVKTKLFVCLTVRR